MKYLLCILFVAILNSIVLANNKQVFPLQHYNQDVDHWLNNSQNNYDQELLSSQNQALQFSNFKRHYFGTDVTDPSPWNMSYVTQIIKGSATNSIYQYELELLNTFDNSKISDQTKILFGMNQRPLSDSWIRQVSQNLNVEQFKQIIPKQSNRAIMVANTFMRVLPSEDPAFYSDSIAGEGYPFDKLENSVIYVGTPVYIISSTKDHKWDLVLSPSLISWVSDSMLARVDNQFIHKYQVAVESGLAGISNNNISLISANNNYLLTGYVGMFLPLISNDNDLTKLLLPIKVNNGRAEIGEAYVKSLNIVRLPLTLNKKNFAQVLKVMELRPYGWGNLHMYNDCSSEMKSIFTLFGIFIPRNTANIDHAGQAIDISGLDIKKRVNYLLTNGLPLLTLIHIKGHVMLYIGDYINQDSHYPLIYQQVWGLRPLDNSYRSIIGQSVFFPLWSEYPENKELRSTLFASMFRLIYLNSTKLYVPKLQELL